MMKKFYNMLMNLEVISSLPAGLKLKKMSEEGNLEIDYQTRFSYIHRFLNNESRKNTIKDLNTVISYLINMFDDVTSSEIFKSKILKKQFDDIEFLKYYSILSNIHIHFSQSIKGLLNLKLTYNSDEDICNNIELLIFEISKYIDLFEKKYKIKNLDHDDIIPEFF